MTMTKTRKLALLAVAFAVCGCGGQKITVKGKVTKDGKPLQVSTQGAIHVIFSAVEGNETGRRTYTAQAEPDGTFAVVGRDGEGILPGRYRIGISVLDPYPEVDTLKGEFGLDKTPIVRQVTGKEEMVIDLSRPAGG